MSKPKAMPPVDPYRAEDDARTLQRAGEVMGDTARHNAAMGHLQKQMDGVKRIMGASPAPAKKSSGLGFAKARK